MANLLALFNSTITAAIDADDTSLVLEKLTSIPTAPFNAILDAGSADEEVVNVTAVTTATKTLTITRAQGGTTAVAHAKGTLFHHCEIGAVNIDLDGLTSIVLSGTVDVAGISHLRGLAIMYGGFITAGSSTLGGPSICSSSFGVGGTLTTNQILCNSSLGVAGATTLNGAVVCVGSLAIGGPLTMHQVVNALELPAADPAVAGRLWVNAGVVTRSAG